MPYVVQQFIALKEMTSWFASETIPALLAQYSCVDVSGLPKPVQDDIAFLEKVLETVSTAIIFEGALLIFTRRYLQDIVLDDGMRIGTQKKQIEAFIQFMLQVLFEGRTDTLFHATDAVLPLMSFFQEATKRYTELTQAELKQALHAKPTLKMSAPLSMSSSFEQMKVSNRWIDMLEWTQQPTVVDFMNVFDVLEQFDRFFLPKDPAFFKGMPSKSPLIVFFESSMRVLVEFNCSHVLKQHMMHGLMKSLVDVIYFEDIQRPDLNQFDEWLVRQVNKLEENASCFTICQASVAAYLLLQLQMFDGGHPEHGRAVLPCFGLEDVDMWRYSQSVLTLFERATYEWVAEHVQVSQAVSLERFCELS
ncbi:MAG: hypothetical protein NTW08_02715 [Gammaproteobacteria bacterium]|nr:hypothetical protein [Gammaproteobacteria bacterium]